MYVRTSVVALCTKFFPPKNFHSCCFVDKVFMKVGLFVDRVNTTIWDWLLNAVHMYITIHVRLLLGIVAG